MATYQLPHHKLIAYEVAKELLVAVRETHVRDAGLRDQALRSAKSACLNCAEGAGRATRVVSIANRLIAMLTGLIRR